MTFDYENIKSKISSWNLKHQRVFLRADLNVPLENDQISDDLRLKRILLTLDMLLEKDATIILATHLGRPKNQERNLSTKIIAQWLQDRGYPIHFEPNLEKVNQVTISKHRQKGIILLENLRFFEGEKSKDHEFAKILRSLADFYINDAFGTAHRSDTSLTLLPQLFDREKRTIGPLFEQELRILTPIKLHAAHPYIIILGGGKAKDKIKYIEGFIGKATKILLCPTIAFPFMNIQKITTGMFIFSDSDYNSEKLIDITEKARKLNTQILFPKDYLVAHSTLHGSLSYVDADNIPNDGHGISIGPKTIEIYKNEILNSQTVIFNASMGFPEQPETMKPTYELIKALGETSGYSIVGGGDSVAAVHKISMQEKINYISTGGGAMLSYLSDNPIPTLDFIA